MTAPEVDPAAVEAAVFTWHTTPGNFGERMEAALTAAYPLLIADKDAEIERLRKWVDEHDREIGSVILAEAERDGAREDRLKALTERDEVLAEIERLRRWKDEALPVMDGLQELGRALDMPLGTRITGRTSLDAVLDLKNDLAEARAAIDAAVAERLAEVLAPIEALASRFESTPDRHMSHVNIAQSISTTLSTAKEATKHA